MAQVETPAAPAPAATTPAAPAEQQFAPLAAFLSYLVPGLGQIAQGRVGKGLLFLVCIYTLFFYGQHLGSGVAVVDGTEYRVNSNVFFPDLADEINPLPRWLQRQAPRWVVNLCNRPQFAGQFWVGIAAWPAIWHYWHPDPVNGGRVRVESPLFGDYQRTPREEAINAVQAAGNKILELGWVYTVIAGVLNVMVIYDALAGPAFVLPRPAAPFIPPPQPQPVGP